MSGVLVYSERNSLTLELISGGRNIAASTGSPICVALLGPGAATFSETCIKHGAQRAYVVDDPRLDEHEGEPVTEALAQIVGQADADLILIGSTRRGRNVAPRLAQKLDAGCVTDAFDTKMQDGRLLSRRFSLGGNTIKEIAITSAIAVVAVTPGTFDAADGGASSADPGDDKVVEVALNLAPSRAKIVSREAKASGTVNIEEAERIICVGRGVENQDDLALIQTLADALNAELAGTRPLAYEYGWITEDRMIGISGKTVRPQLYVAIGLSGQIQHSVSIRDAKTILAINKDKNAPIFEMSDYGIVGDLYEVVPRLTEALKKS